MARFEARSRCSCAGPKAVPVKESVWKREGSRSYVCGLLYTECGYHNYSKVRLVLPMCLKDLLQSPVVEEEVSATLRLPLHKRSKYFTRQSQNFWFTKEGNLQRSSRAGSRRRPERVNATYNSVTRVRI